MASVVLDCTVRPVLMALAVGVLLRLMGIRRPATHHAAWTAVVVAMLVMPLWAATGLKLPVPILSPAGVMTSAATLPDARAARASAANVVGGEVGVAPATSRASDGVFTWTRVLVTVYFAGVSILLLRLLVGVIYARQLCRQAMVRDGRLTSGRCVSPITIGWFAPKVILPIGWREWSPATLNAILQHETEHARRRDPLVQGLTLVNRAVFWFHPLAWWLERRVAMLAEESCDAAVLAAGHSPVDYTESLLHVARSVRARGARVRAVGMAMPGSGLNRRMQQILNGPPVPPASRTRIISTAALCAASTVLLAATDVTTRHSADIASSLPVAGQTANVRYPAFDVVSVKPCDRDAPSQGRGGGGSPITSPGRLYLQCYRLSSLLSEAYIYFSDGRAHGLSSTIDVGVEGGPDWMKSERYTIEAKTGTAAAPAVMRGPMLQAVLEDRFKLKVRRVSREMPVYELVVAKSGAKVSPYTGHDCVIKDVAVWPPLALPSGQEYCGDRSKMEGDRFVRTGVLTLDELASLLAFDRPVVNRTGITAPVSYRFDYSREDATIGTLPASVIAALRNQLGLDIRPSKGPREFLVIEHVERPTPN